LNFEQIDNNSCHNQKQDPGSSKISIGIFGYFFLLLWLQTYESFEGRLNGIFVAIYRKSKQINDRKKYNNNGSSG